MGSHFCIWLKFKLDKGCAPFNCPDKNNRGGRKKNSEPGWLNWIGPSFKASPRRCRGSRETESWRTCWPTTTTWEATWATQTCRHQGIFLCSKFLTSDDWTKFYRSYPILLSFFVFLNPQIESQNCVCDRSLIAKHSAPKQAFRTFF